MFDSAHKYACAFVVFELSARLRFILIDDLNVSTSQWIRFRSDCRTTKMPTIIHEGITYEQRTHAIYCKKCKTTIESKYRHDFKYCPCGSIGIDGGIHAGNTILGDFIDMEPRSTYCAVVNKKKVWLPQSIVISKFYPSLHSL